MSSMSRRLSLKGAAALVAVLAMAGTALAAETNTDVLLSSNVALPTDVSIGANNFQINVTATGNVSNTQSGGFTVTTVYNMATNGTITAGATTQTFDLTPSGGSLNFGDGTTQDCAVASPPAGCAANPIVVNAVLNVAAGTPNGTTGTLTVAITGTQGTTADPSPDQGYVRVVTSSCSHTVQYLRPIDQSTDSGLVGNTFKRGRVVPVKAIVMCGSAYITGQTGEAVTIDVKDVTFAATATDSLEQYSDAGSSSAGTQDFRWQNDTSAAGGGYWLYNLDTTKGFTIGTSYKVKVVIDGTSIASPYAILVPQK